MLRWLLGPRENDTPAQPAPAPEDADEIERDGDTTIHYHYAERTATILTPGILIERLLHTPTDDE